MINRITSPDKALLLVEAQVYDPGNDPQGKLAISAHQDGTTLVVNVWQKGCGVWQKVLPEKVIENGAVSPQLLQDALEALKKAKAIKINSDEYLQAAVLNLQTKVAKLLVGASF